MCVCVCVCAGVRFKVVKVANVSLWHSTPARRNGHARKQTLQTLGVQGTFTSEINFFK